MARDWLTAELKGDPLNWGYATLADTFAITALLNDATKDRPVAQNAVTAADLVVCVHPGELVATPLPGLAQWWIDKLLPALAGAAIDPHDPRVAALRDGLFPAAVYPQTNAALVALQTRRGSRAEELAGAGTVVTAEQVQAARQAAGMV